LTISYVVFNKPSFHIVNRSTACPQEVAQSVGTTPNKRRSLVWINLPPLVWTCQKKKPHICGYRLKLRVQIVQGKWHRGKRWKQTFISPVFAELQQKHRKGRSTKLITIWACRVQNWFLSPGSYFVFMIISSSLICSLGSCFFFFFFF
jgi:hypothetical protein